MANTIIVSNRLPVSIKKGDNGFEAYPSVGGLATGLSSYANKRGNLWIGWPGIESDDLNDEDKVEISKLLRKYNCQPVFLTSKQLDDYYNGYSNSVLWPFFHSMKPDFSNEVKQWKAYREVNQRFADVVLTLSEPGATIWVHDYQLLLVPEMLRRQRPTDRIGFFLHIPFPPAKEFAKLDSAPALIRGILGVDLAGFHTKDYAKNFLEAAPVLTSAVPVDGGLTRRGRVVQVSDFPIGIDYVKFNQATHEKVVKAELASLRRKYYGKKVILTVDRLDPTKGFIERLEAYRTFLRETPELSGKVVMIMLAVPSREEVDAYAKLKVDVEELVKEINKEFGSKLWKPIVYMYKSVPFEYLSALYQLADVGFVAPIKDGMNLVAKEYVASQSGRNNGILILSQTAGAAQELKEALFVNHARPRSLVNALKESMTMPPKELKRRVDSLQDTISTNTIQAWAGDFMKTLEKPISGQKVPPLTKLRQENLLRNYQGALKRLILLDYDGVLTPFRSDPNKAAPSPETIKILKKISAQKGNTVAVVSGRSKQDLEKWLGKLPLTLVAEHGGLIRQSGREWDVFFDLPEDWKDIIKPALEKHARLTPGAFVEEKHSSLVWHFRSARPYFAQKNVAILKSALRPFLRQLGLKLYMGNKILEIKSPEITKGETVKRLLTENPYDFIMCIGDDFTDEDMFKALPKRAYTFKVGPGRTAARYRLKNTAEVQELLNRL